MMPKENASSGAAGILILEFLNIELYFSFLTKHCDPRGRPTEGKAVWRAGRNQYRRSESNNIAGASFWNPFDCVGLHKT
jgi:hypothetical protein